MKQNHTGIEYWRSLEQFADDPAIAAAVEREFPGYDADTMATTSRRSFLKLMAASLALAGVGLSGCRRVPVEKLAPYAAGPRDRVPGVPERYATQFELNGVATGLLVTSYDGRPVKVEGNPSHPFAWTVKDKVGAACALAQASVLELYDPERSRSVVDRTGGRAVASTWDAFAAAVGRSLTTQFGKGQGVAVLTEPASGPSAENMRKRFAEAFPEAEWYEYDPLSRDAELEATRLVYGRPLRPVLHLDAAKAVVLLDADVLGTDPCRVRYAADWAATRRSADTRKAMGRVHLAECGFSATGAVADERLAVAPDRIEPLARAIAVRLTVPLAAAEPTLTAAETRFVAAAVADLKAAGPSGVLSCGPAAAAEAHAVALLVNRHLGAVGTTVTLHADANGDRPTHLQAIVDLAGKMAAGKVQTLLVIGGNPAYDAPADLNFAKLLAAVPTSVRLGLYEDETSVACKWHLPRAHYLEAWNDARAADGIPGVAQPLIEPLFDGKSNLELLAMLTADAVNTGDQIVRRAWQPILGEDGFDKAFRQVVEAGAYPAGAAAATNPRTKRLTVPAAEAPATTPAGGLVLRVVPGSTVHDGRFANNAWLQETPDLLTKLVWDNALLMSARDAAAAGLSTNDWAVVKADGRFAPAVVYVMPGQPAGVVSLAAGYGRTAAGTIGNKVGTNAYALRTSRSTYTVTGVTVSKGYGSYALATTQNHHIMDPVGVRGMEHKVGKRGASGEIIREASFEQYKLDPRAASRGEGRTVSLQLFEPPSKFNDPHAWGMAVDLNACVGCNACTVACQSENNIPVVGRDQVLMHRQMNWIRIDRYFKGEPAAGEVATTEPGSEDVDVVFQPVMCQHCENAPCEQVCPATATVHDTEGLNTMVYNRCIGTRYCSNNCAYKVRRFNYFDFHSKPPRDATATAYLGIPDSQQDEQVDKLKRMAFNSEVTVRMRGVMEKCTYCVQRIHSVITARRAEGKAVADGDVMTACQQACPTQAITFGDLNDQSAGVTAQHRDPRAYDLLGELNTRPRTKCLAKLRNPAANEAGGTPPTVPHASEHA